MVPYLDALSAQALSPQDYVIQKFEDHRVVILGEPHRVREHGQFLTELLQPLQESGVWHVGVELFTSQADVDSLLSSTNFNEVLARRVVLSAPALLYYQELYDLLRRGWELNQNEPGFRLLALYQGGWRRDLNMAETVRDLADAGHKVLVYCGTHHAFTRYSQPSLDFWRTPQKRDRMGNYLHDGMAPDAFFIKFHYPVYKRFWLFVPILLYRQAYCLISVMDMALQDEVTQQQVVDYVGQIADLIRPLSPKLVYFRQNDVAQSIRKLGAERGEEWVQEFIQLIESNSTFRNIDFTGFTGMVQFLENYRALVEAAIRVMDVQKLSIDTTAGDWSTYYEEVDAFLSFEGRDLYRNGGNRHLCPSDDKTPASLVFDNRTDRSLAVSWWPYKSRFAEHALEIQPHETLPYQTTLGYRFRIYDTNCGEIMQDVIAAESPQIIVIGIQE
ncbi:MAG: hypothetical protein GKR89_04915 [Candidatus Latescibacteria bacterium]|nr:hypothetical protein [Candidatus Latescibacterota bacterium]